MTPTLYDKVQEASQYLKDSLGTLPECAIVAGTGLSGLADELEAPLIIPYQDIPHFPTPSVQGHLGQMVAGEMQGRQVLVMQGRFHYYEGYSMEEITFHVRVFAQLGIPRLVITNASGALNPNINAGDMVLVSDHINLQPDNPLRGIQDERLGLRFPTLDQVYDKAWLAKAATIAQAKGFAYHKGVYVAVPGPSLETLAEYRYMSRLGGDVVGMSTVPEVIVAAQCGLPVLVVSACTNNPFGPQVATTIEEVLQVAGSTGIKIRELLRELLRE